MNWLLSLDVALFRFINGTLSNPVFDRLMPFASGNAFFVPAVFLIAIALIWKGGTRGRICLLLIVLTVAIGDGWICKTLKEAIARPRPFLEIEDARLLLGKGKSFSMPSSHAANWFSVAMVTFIYYRRSWRFMLPLAFLVGFSRIYNGVHYPSDVLAGAILGAGYGVAVVLLANVVWNWAGWRWFPLWWQKLPSLANPGSGGVASRAVDAPAATQDQHFLRLGYLFIFVVLLFRLFYLASPVIELSEDEAYQWVWSKHPALSYFSKPPLIAYTQLLGTTLWGDTEFGVRFFSPVIAAILSFLLLRFFAREVNARVGLVLVAMLCATPLTVVGSILMTIDPLSVLFWTAAMLVGWRAVQNDGSTRHWIWVGVWTGLGFLSKYTNLFQLLCWVVLFLLWAPARKHLRRPGPYLALLLVVLSLTPVLVWNSQNGWITIEHVAQNGGIGRNWKPTLRYATDFLVNEAVLLNPIFFVGLVGAMTFFWRSERKNPLAVFLFSMGAPVFLFYFAFSFRSRILPNWIAPSVVPLFCLMAVYFHGRWPARKQILKPLLVAGLTLGFFVVVLMHDTNLTARFFNRTLPAQADPSSRVRAWRATAHAIEQARRKLAAEGRPAFIIGDHYGITGETSFYLPEARRNVRDQPLVFYRSSPHPNNQFYFWPGYQSRIGQNAIYAQQVDLPKLEKGWISKWLRGEKDFPAVEPRLRPAPADIVNQFTSVTDTGVTDIYYGDRVFRRVQLFECRGLREAK